ncbi:MAG: NADH-quinone oxidoreductase subunit N [Candidatus Njordarchaeales archaeon]
MIITQLSIDYLLYLFIGTITLTLVLDFLKEKARPLNFVLSILATVGGIAFLMIGVDGNLLVLDTYAKVFAGIFLFSVLIILPALYSELWDVTRSGVFTGLILASVLGTIIAVTSRNLILIVVGWELASISSYALVGIRRRDKISTEAAMKYFLVGAVGSGLIFFGLSLIFGATASLDLLKIAEVITSGTYDQVLARVGILIFSAGIGFKLAIVPFHVWIPDVYEGAPNSVTSYLAAVSKGMAFAVAIRVFYQAFLPIKEFWAPIFAILAIITMTYGNLAALVQEKMKRMLAWSSIAHAGYMLIALGAPGTSPVVIIGAIFHVLTHAFMKITSFVAARGVTDITGTDLIDDYMGLRRIAPGTSASLTIMMLSLAGIPPLAGFWSKYYIFLGAVENGYPLLALIGVINSVISLFYYARVIKNIYVEESPKEGVTRGIKIGYAAPIAILTILVLVLGIYPTPLFEILEKSVAIF